MQVILIQMNRRTLQNKVNYFSFGFTNEASLISNPHLLFDDG